MFAVASVFNLMQVGFMAGIARFVADLRAHDRLAELQRTVSSALALMAGLGALAAVISVAVALLGDGLAAGGQGGASRPACRPSGASWSYGCRAWPAPPS